MQVSLEENLNPLFRI